MFQNKKFSFHTVMLALTGLVYMFLAAGLQGGLADIITHFTTPDGGGWDVSSVLSPVWLGGFLCIPLSFVCGTCFIKYGVRRTLIPSTILAAAGCMGLVAANGQDIYGGAASGAYWLLFISLLICRCAALALQMGVFALCAGWFIRYRGQVMGVVSAGGAIFYAVGAGPMAGFIRAVFGGDHRPFFLIMAALLAILAAATRFLLRDVPEENGLYPDGDGRAPASEPDREEGPLPARQVLKGMRPWLILIAYGAFLLAAAGCVDTAEKRLMSRCSESMYLASYGLLALGTVLAIPASFLFGWLGDRLGIHRASLILGAAMLIAPFALWVMPRGGSMFLAVILALGMACIAGISSLLPCAIADTYGRRQYLAASRVFFSVLSIPAAIGPMLGYGGGTYFLLLVLAAIGCLAAFGMFPVKKTGGAQKR